MGGKAHTHACTCAGCRYVVRPTVVSAPCCPEGAVHNPACQFLGTNSLASDEVACGAAAGGPQKGIVPCVVGKFRITTQHIVVWPGISRWVEPHPVLGWVRPGRASLSDRLVGCGQGPASPTHATSPSPPPPLGGQEITLACAEWRQGPLSGGLTPDTPQAIFERFFLCSKLSLVSITNPSPMAWAGAWAMPRVPTARKSALL